MCYFNTLFRHITSYHITCVNKPRFFFFSLDGLGCVACSHSELILKLWLLQTVGRTRRKAATHTWRHKHTMKADFHALSGMRTQYPSFWAGQDISCLRPNINRPKCTLLSSFNLSYLFFLSFPHVYVSYPYARCLLGYNIIFCLNSKESRPYSTGDPLRLHGNHQSTNAAWRDNRYLLCESNETRKCTVRANPELLI
jgi:hypothetical protein